jgi:hypothetical protein
MAAEVGGPEPVPQSPRAESIAGDLVTEALDYDGGCQVTVYRPPDPPEAVVFAGDGQAASQWGGFLDAAGVPPTMIVGVHGLADETLRLQEYSPAFNAERFAAHERSSSRRWAAGCGRGSESRCPPSAPRSSAPRPEESWRSPLA